MLKISSLIRQDREFSASISAMAESYRAESPLPIAINGLSEGARDAYIAAAAAEAWRISSAPTVLLVGSDEEGRRLTALLAGEGVRARYFPDRELVFSNISASHDIERERLSVLYDAAKGNCECVVATPSAAILHTIPRDRLLALSACFELGDEVPIGEIALKLSELGYSLADAVEGRGQYSRRGGIIDLWPSDAQTPVRIELFGDEIDRIASFDPITQRAKENMTRLCLLPATEVIVDAEARERILLQVKRALECSELSDEMRERLHREQSACVSGASLDFRDKYIDIIYREKESMFSYFASKRCIVFVNGTSECRDSAGGRVEKIASSINAMASVGAALRRSMTYTVGTEGYESFLNDNLTVHLNPFAGGIGSMKLSGLFGFRCRPVVGYGSNARMLAEDVESFRKGGYRIVIMSANEGGCRSVAELLEESGIGTVTVAGREDVDPSEYPCGSVLLAVGAGRGFDLITPKIALLSTEADSGRAVMQNKRRKSMLRRIGGAGKRLLSHAELQVGDYVVHSNFGIGLFEGIETVTAYGVTKDYITIRYAGTDKLLVPCDRLEVIGKYIGERDSDGKVKLSKMGGTEWHRAKAKAKGAAEDIAKRLIAIYAERQRTAGFAFPRTSELEDKFDSEFEFLETESQLTAIEEIKRDMEKAVPMNRLLCGDVGFGKTEVALRAAFKAILGGKQVAILVPTTILALQHYQTALSRMRGYAVNIEMISRFKKPKERADILRRTAKGAVDILIGTHAIIGKGVEFKDLGLLIIDEEQRFGVAQKERLREMAKNVDTLMLSATPIPRTLNMAMSGISDISVLDEAPGERRPVETYVLEHDDETIIEAIRRELDRRGQVLYLYNKVETIDHVAGKIQEALPNARVAYAHGQMEKEELEDIWQWLVRGEIDVLVCTTIIETGVDLPGANTLIIENADRFGLSQLHQIRGRVGRSERQAYAYLTYRAGKSLSEIAEKRLKTIKEFASFGAGFKIALRDMEIRGAGNLLGAEQHGYIESVGYGMYVKLLNEAIIEQRGEKKPEEFESVIRIQMSAHIPESYIPSSTDRMQMYKKISHIESVSDKDEIVDEFIDRFGDMPRTVERLVDVALAKAMAERARISKVEYDSGRLVFVTEKPRLDIWSEVFADYPGLGFVGVGSPLIACRTGKDRDPCRLAADILCRYVEVMSE